MSVHAANSRRGQLTFAPGGTRNPDTRLDARGRLTTYALDSLNRPLETLYSDGALVTRTYDALGRVTTLLDGAGTTRTGYDLLGRVLEVDLPTGQALTYQYDGMGNRRWMQDPNDGMTSYTWDANERLTEIVNPYGETTGIEYDDLGREWNKTLDNGMVVSHAYDAAGRETELANLASDGSALALFTATYDPAGNRLGVRETVNGASAHVSYLYDTADQLTREWRTGANAYDVSYTYDEAGNRGLRNSGGSLTTHTYDEANEPRVTVEPGGARVTHTWDANGNLVETVSSSAPQAPEEFQWNDENRLASNSKYGIVVSHDYLPNGLRRYTVATPQPEPDFFVWDGQNLLIERHQGSDLMVPPVRTQYTDFPGVWGGLVSQRRADTSHFYGFDLQGNTQILVDASGAVTDTEVFTAFGERVAVSGNTPHRLRYAGRWGYQAEGLDLLYVRLGWADPDWGRWIRRDPLWPEEGPNWYLYVGNRVPNVVDPSGMKWRTMGPCPHPNWREYGITQTNHEDAIDTLCDLLKGIYHRGRGKELAATCLGGDAKLLDHLVRWCDVGVILCHSTCAGRGSDGIETCGRAWPLTRGEEWTVWLCPLLFLKPGMAEFERRKQTFKKRNPGKLFRPCPPVAEIVLHEVVHLGKPGWSEDTVRQVSRCIVEKGVVINAWTSAEETTRESVSMRRMQTLLTFANILSNPSYAPDVAEAVRRNLAARLASTNPLNMPRNMAQFAEWSVRVQQQGENDLLRAAYRQASADLASGDPERAYAGFMAFVDFAGAVASLSAKGSAIPGSPREPRPPLAAELISAAAPAGRGTELQAGSSLALPPLLTEQQTISAVNRLLRGR